MAVVQQGNAPLFEFWKAAFEDALLRSHLPKVAGFVMGDFRFWLICNQHFHHHAAGLFGTL